MARPELVVAANYDAIKLRDLIQSRGPWTAEFVKVSNVDLVPTDPGAAVVCGDGRPLEDLKMYGPRVFGQVNGIAAMKHGGNLHAIVKASQDIMDAGFKPGTHGDHRQLDDEWSCGFYGKWRNHLLKEVPYQWDMEDVELMKQARAKELKDMAKPAAYIRGLMRAFGGKHFKHRGEHVEKALRINPFVGTTEANNRGDRFMVDDWFTELLGINFELRNKVAAETVEQLKRDAMRVELLVR